MVRQADLTRGATARPKLPSNAGSGRICESPPALRRRSIRQASGEPELSSISRSRTCPAAPLPNPALQGRAPSLRAAPPAPSPAEAAWTRAAGSRGQAWSLSTCFDQVLPGGLRAPDCRERAFNCEGASRAGRRCLRRSRSPWPRRPSPPEAPAPPYPWTYVTMRRAPSPCRRPRRPPRGSASPR